MWGAACLLAGAVRRAAQDAEPGRATDLWRQARRAADSIGANIAEGAGRRTPEDRLRYFGIAAGSIRETQHHLRLCRNYELIPGPEYLRLIGLTSVTRRMLDALMRRVK